MSTTTNIEWTDRTWNPVIGCSPVSPGCLNCYAATMAYRLQNNPKVPDYRPRPCATCGGTGACELEGVGHECYACKQTGTIRIAERKAGRAVFTGDVRCLPERLTEPLSWRKPSMVFVNSMSDLFHEAVPFEFIDRVFAVMALSPRHTFQVLTKRPERMAEYLASDKLTLGAGGRVCAAAAERVSAAIAEMGEPYVSRAEGVEWPLPNVWLGTSCDRQQEADERIPHLLRCPAAVRFLSCEPLLGPIDLSGALRTAPSAPRIDWVITGGESGAGARPCNIAWIRSIVEQCREAGVPCFVKQLGGRPILGSIHDTGLDWPDGTRFTTRKGDPHGRSIVLADPKGGDPAEWPEDLRVRQMPQKGTP